MITMCPGILGEALHRLAGWLARRGILTSINMDHLAIHIRPSATTEPQNHTRDIRLLPSPAYTVSTRPTQPRAENLPAGTFSLTLASNLSLLPASNPTALISPSTTAGATQLTLTPSPKNAWAHSLVRCTNAAMDAEYAKRPCECVFVTPARFATFSTRLECPGAALAPASSSGSSAAVRKWCAVTFPAQATRHASGPSSVIHAFTASESLKSSAPPAAGVDEVVGRACACVSGLTLPALRRMLMPLASWVERKDAMPVIPSVVVVSPGRLGWLVCLFYFFYGRTRRREYGMIWPLDEYFSATVSRISSRLPMM